MTEKNLSDKGHNVRAPFVLALFGAVGLMMACESEPTAIDETAYVQVLLTDAPTDMLDSAHVWISHVYLVGGGGSEPDTAEADTTSAGNGKLDLYNDPANPLKFDLLQLRDGVTADLTGQVPVEASTYQGLRFVVDSAKVTLAEGYTFQNGTRVDVLKVPSGQRSGIKVKLKDVLSLDENDVMTVTVDFDVDENFKIQMDNQSGDVRRVMFKPVLREKKREES